MFRIALYLFIVFINLGVGRELFNIEISPTSIFQESVTVGLFFVIYALDQIIKKLKS